MSVSLVKSTSVREWFCFGNGFKVELGILTIPRFRKPFLMICESFENLFDLILALFMKTPCRILSSMFKSHKIYSVNLCGCAQYANSFV